MNQREISQAVRESFDEGLALGRAQAVQDGLRRLGHGVGDVNDLDLRKWPPQAIELVQDLVAKLEQAEDLIRNLGGDPPF